MFGLGLQLACAAGAGARRENPEKEINKQVAARVLRLLCSVVTPGLEVSDTRCRRSGELNTQIC